VKRRDFITLLGGTAVAWPLAARAQQIANIPRIGFLRLGSTSSPSYAGRVKALRTGLRELGYVEGHNIVIEFRGTEPVEQLSEFAAELVRMNVNIIFATSSTEVGVVQQLTKTIPIMFATHADPVGLGHVASLARPGTSRDCRCWTELTAKGLEILKDVVPHAARFSVLFTPTAPSYAPLLQAAEAVGAKLRVAIHKVPVQSVDDFDAAFATMARERVDGIFVHGSWLTAAHVANRCA
jgi:putative ABC transport system substrate-binding protein